jgi:CRP/FNR family cyclic AMP-dependent transcriptional regulator
VIGPDGASHWPEPTLLGRLRGSTRRDLLCAGVPTKYPVRTRILRQGEISNHVVLLLSGLVKIQGLTEGGHEVLLAVRIAGDLVGEMAALEDTPRSATVIASVPTRARVISRSEFAAFLHRHPDAALEVTRMVSSRLRWANRRRMDFTAHSARTRMGRVLAEVLQVYGHRCHGGWDLGVALSQAEIASLAGVALRTAQKVLHALAAEGVVERRYRKIRVVDPEALYRIAELPAENPP